MNPPPSISAAIITFNEERNIRRCLESLGDVVDEIVVVDSFSTDTTRNICEEFSVRFIQNPFEGHIQQKNFALQATTHHWVLSLDADEALTDELRQSIRDWKLQPNGAGAMNRLTNYCGKWVHHCGWYPDTKIRLVDRRTCKWGGVNPHDKLLLPGDMPVIHLEGDLLHYSYYTREDHLKQITYFSSIAAKELHARGKSSGFGLIFIKVLAQFFKSFFLKRGFLDGSTGWTISRLSAYATFRKYDNLRKLNQGREL
ncbi:MAG: glycosyltransferase family 2 protein [Flavobacteriales bacterium]|nr:glycosyltransferase family 2 protein [Flavobacteriales bacterium]